MYKILGDGGQVFGPADAELVRQWIAQGRLNAQSQIQIEGETGWRALGTVPEFSASFGGFSAPQKQATQTDYSLDIMGCVKGGWELFTNNTGILIGTFVIYLLIAGAFSVLGLIPLVGWVFSILFWVIAGPLMAGLYQVALQALRRQPTRIGDMFAASNNCFGQLFLAQVIPSLLLSLCFLPGLVLAALIVIPSLFQNQAPGGPQVVFAVGCFLLGMLPLIYLSVNWMFTIPLVMDKGLGFWSAMRTSSKGVRKHWWSVFGFLIVLGLVNLLGILCCFVGLLVTVPVTIAAMMVAYEKIFGSESSANS